MELNSNKPLKCACCGGTVPSESVVICAECMKRYNEAPCKGCTKRYQSCHMHCQTYLAWYEHHKKVDDIIKALQTHQSSWFNSRHFQRNYSKRLRDKLRKRK